MGTRILLIAASVALLTGGAVVFWLLKDSLGGGEYSVSSGPTPTLAAATPTSAPVPVGLVGAARAMNRALSEITGIHDEHATLADFERGGPQGRVTSGSIRVSAGVAGDYFGPPGSPSPVWVVDASGYLCAPTPRGNSCGLQQVQVVIDAVTGGMGFSYR
jgi:hypothetical protein